MEADDVGRERVARQHALVEQAVEQVGLAALLGSASFGAILAGVALLDFLVLGARRRPPPARAACRPVARSRAWSISPSVAVTRPSRTRARSVERELLGSQSSTSASSIASCSLSHFSKSVRLSGEVGADEAANGTEHLEQVRLVLGLDLGSRSWW